MSDDKRDPKTIPPVEAYYWRGRSGGEMPTPSTPPGDWEVVVEAWDWLVNAASHPGNQSWAEVEAREAKFDAALARLREREAQLERERNERWPDSIYQRTANDLVAETIRAEAAEVALKAEARQRIKDCEDRNAYKRRADIAEARVKELERHLEVAQNDLRIEINERNGAEARVQELEQQLCEIAEKGYERVLQSAYENALARVKELEERVRDAEAERTRLFDRIAELEAALREIAVGYQDVISLPDVDRIMALAHEEEA